MAEIIVAPDSEARAVAFLKAQFSTLGDVAQVGTKFPTKGSRRFVQVTRAGGASNDIAYDAPRLVFICSGVSTTDAERLCALTRGIILAWSRLSDDITRVRDAGEMAYVPDPDSGQDRYQFAVQAVMKMSAI